MQRRTKKLLIVFVVGPIVLIGFGAAALAVRQYQVTETTKRSYIEGRNAFEKGDYAKALPLIARYVGRHQKDLEAVLMLAECRARVPKPEGSEIVEAARYAEAALAIDRKNPRPLELLLDYYGRVGFVTELNRVCDDMLALNPHHAGALTAKTRALLTLGQYDAAREMIDRLTALDPSDSERFRLVLEIRRLQGAAPDQIASEAGELARQFPESLEIQVIHAQTLLGSGDVKGAMAAIERAASLKPTSLRGIADFLRLSDLASVLLRIGSREDPKAKQERLRELGRTLIRSGMSDPGLRPHVAAIAVGWEWRAAKLSNAQAWIDRGLEGTPITPSLLAWKAMLARESGKDWQVDVRAIREVETSPPHLWSTLVESLDALDQGQLAKAGEHLTSVASQAQQILGASRALDQPSSSPQVVEAYDALVLARLFRGSVDQIQGEWRLAIEQWTEAGDAEPAWSLPRVKIARAYMERGQSKAALDAAMQAFRIRNGALEGLTLAKAIVARDEAAGSSQELASLLTTIISELDAIEGLQGEVLCLRGRAAAARRDQATVSAVVRDITAMEPAPDKGLMLSLARSIRAAGLDGSDLLLTAADEHGGLVEVALVRASDAAAAGRRDEALAILRSAAAAQPSVASLPLRLQEASLLAAAGSLQEGRELLRSLSKEHASMAWVQLSVLDQPLAWTEASLIDEVVRRLRAASGDRGVEWQLADATRLLTFSPDPSKAQEVIIRLTAIVRANPQNAHALTLLSEWMLVLKNETEAINYLSRAIEVSDSPPGLYPRLISLLSRAGRSDEARARLEQFALLDRLPPEVRRSRAGLFRELGMPERAAEDLRVLADQGTVSDRLVYADALNSQGKSAAALRMIDQVLAQSDLTQSQFMSAAVLLVDSGQADRALMLLDERANRMGLQDRIPLDRSLLLERAGRTEEAESLLITAASSAKEPEPVLVLARFYVRRSQQSKAREAIAAAKARGLTSAELDSLDALAAAALQPLTEAQQQSVIDSIPPGPMRELAEATLWFDSHPNESREFISRLRKITSAEPRLVLAWQFLVDTLIRIGDVKEAVSAARSASEASPNSQDAARMEANTMLLAGRVNEARSAALRWLSLASDPFEPRLCLAKVEIMNGRLSDAREALEPLWAHAAALKPKAAQHQWLAWVACYAAIGEVDRARTLVSMRSPEEPGLLEGAVRIAAADAVPLDEARQWLESMRTALSGTVEQRIGLAEAYATLASRSESDQDFQRALELLEPRLQSKEAGAGDFLFAASLLERQGRISEAESNYRRAIEKEPSNWIGLNNLAYLLIQRRGDAAEALSLARRASEVAEKAALPASARSSVLQTLALALLRSGNGNEALATIRRAIALDTASAEARLTEIEALEATGDRSRALALLEALLKESESGALDLKPDESARAQTLVERLRP